jgi:hypothetical protein
MIRKSQEQSMVDRIRKNIPRETKLLELIAKEEAVEKARKKAIRYGNRLRTSENQRRRAGLKREKLRVEVAASRADEARSKLEVVRLKEQEVQEKNLLKKQMAQMVDSGDGIMPPRDKNPPAAGGFDDIAPLDDIKWIYNNLTALTLPGPDGKMMVNQDVLKTAPSTGALTLAMYAVEHPTAFIEKFVVKLLPKNTAVVADESADELKERLDPDLDGLEGYFQTPTREVEEKDKW